MSGSRETSPLLVAEHVVKSFPVRRTLGQIARGMARPRLTALDDVSIGLDRGQVLGIVGESGSGKSTLAYCLVRLLELDSGKVSIGSEDIHALRGGALRDLRRRVQMIFQDPYSSLNPHLTVGRAVAEPARVHDLVDRAGAPNMVADLLERCGLRREDGGALPSPALGWPAPTSRYRAGTLDQTRDSDCRRAGKCA